MEAVRWDRRVLDIVMHLTSVIHAVPWSLVEENSPIREKSSLGDDLWIGKLGDLATRILDACDAAGVWNSVPVRQYGELYSFVRERVRPKSGSIRWDEDGRLFTCIALSRLYHPTSISLRYSARAVLHLDGEVDEIIPGPIYGSGSEVWMANGNNYRNWLTNSDVDPLRNFITQASSALKNMPPRLSRAMWYHEYVSRIQYVDVRWTLICTGLESLLKTDRYASTKQFTTRLVALATELGVILTHKEAEIAYDYRSGLVHGQGFPPISKMSVPIDEEERTDLYKKCETILRTAISRALRSADFRAIFFDENVIRRRWPV